MTRGRVLGFGGPVKGIFRPPYFGMKDSSINRNKVPEQTVPILCHNLQTWWSKENIDAGDMSFFWDSDLYVS